jgi:hypothetical protein
MKHQAITQRAKARQQHINREHASLTELQYTINTLRNQEQRQQPNAIPPPPNYPIPPPPLLNHYTPITNHHHHCHNLVLKSRTEASIRVPRMFNHMHSNNMINR